MKISHRRSGSVIAVALIFAIVLGILIASAFSFGLAERRLNVRHQLVVEARYGAQSVLEHGLGEMRERIARRIVIPTDMLMPGVDPLSVPAASWFTNTHVDPASLVLTAGKFTPKTSFTVTDPNDPLFGTTLDRRLVEVFASATARNSDGTAGHTVRCSTTLEVRYMPWLRDLGDYMPVCEIAPGPIADFDGTFRVNGDMWVQSEHGSRVTFWKPVIVAGGLYHGRAPNSTGTSGLQDGIVEFVNSAGAATRMLVGSTWIDQTLADFAQQAIDRWGGTVQTSVHGVEKLPPPAFDPYVPDDPNTAANERVNGGHKLIELPVSNTTTGQDANGVDLYREDIELQKLSVSSGLVLHVDAAGNITAYKYEPNASGIYTRLDGELTAKYKRTAVTLPSGLATKVTTMWDKRTNASGAMTIIDVDVGVLKTALTTNIAAQKINGFSSSDWNGRVFVEVENPSNRGVRLINGSSIPDVGVNRGMTFGTNTQLYVKGNFNADGTIQAANQMGNPDSANEPPAALVADAITILSKGWQDTNSNKALSSRTAQATEVSAALICGLVPTAASTGYSGGFQNLPRFLENWGGIKFGYRGAMTVLYESEIAKPFAGTDLYSPPDRVWAYNKLFLTTRSTIISDRRSMSRFNYSEYGSAAEFDAAIAAAQL